MDNLIEKLSVGDLRTTGVSDELAKQALDDSSIIETLVQCLTHESAGVRMRSADALEKIGSIKPQFLQPYKTTFLSIAEESKQQEVQWHMAQVIAYLNLSPSEIEQASRLLLAYYHSSKSNIVKVFALTTLTGLSRLDATLKPQVQDLLTTAAASGTPSIKSRAKKLLKDF